MGRQQERIMEVGTHVKLVARHLFRGSQPDLSDAIGVVGESRDEDGHELVSVDFHEHGVFAPDAPVELFEVVRLC